MILVIDNSIEKRMKSYAEQYKLFTDDQEAEAVAHAESCGYSNLFSGTVVPKRPGFALFSKGGDVDVMIVRLEVQNGR